MEESKEVTIPAILVGISAAIMIGGGFVGGGLTGGLTSTLGFLLIFAINVVLGILVCILVGSLIGASFGRFNTAWLKLGAILIFPSAITLLIPFGFFPISFILNILIYFGLLVWLFDLEAFEAFAFTLGLLLVSLAIPAIIAALGLTHITT